MQKFFSLMVVLFILFAEFIALAQEPNLLPLFSKESTESLSIPIDFSPEKLSKVVTTYPNLKSIVIGDSTDFVPGLDCDPNFNFTDEHLLALKGTKKLESLTLYVAGRIRGEALSEFPNLKKLEIACCESITKKGYESIASLTKLTDLSLTRSNKLTDETLEKHISKLSRLTTLSLDISSLKGDSVRHLSNLKNLKHLELINRGGRGFDDKVIDDITQLIQLQSLSIMGKQLFTGATLDKLQGLKNLHSLVLSGNQMTNETLTQVTKLSNLSKLAIANNFAITKIDLSPLSKLQTLYLTRTSIGDDTLKTIPWQNLHKLILDETNVTDKGFENLMQSKNLKILSLGDTKITNTGFAHIVSKFPELEKLHLNGVEITDEAIENLLKQVKSESLRFIGLTDTWVTDDGVRKILTHTPRLENLTRIEFKRNTTVFDTSPLIYHEIDTFERVNQKNIQAKALMMKTQEKTKE